MNDPDQNGHPTATSDPIPGPMPSGPPTPGTTDALDDNNAASTILSQMALYTQQATRIRHLEDLNSLSPPVVTPPLPPSGSAAQLQPIINTYSALLRTQAALVQHLEDLLNGNMALALVAPPPGARQ